MFYEIQTSIQIIILADKYGVPGLVIVSQELFQGLLTSNDFGWMEDQGICSLIINMLIATVFAETTCNALN
jgi:hypothetical protein